MDNMSTIAESTRSVVVERVFAHAPAKVWRALTESPLIAQWLMKNDFELTVGKKFQLRADPVPNWDGVIDCEVMVVEPMKQLSYSWGTMGMGTMVLWTLTPAEGGTHVRVEQTGFREDQPANYKGAQYGWQKFFGVLEKVLEGVQ
jgi:uncharacterized protein YndB with AHSA1/START domain